VPLHVFEQSLWVPGKTMARSARARALGGELLGLYDELKGLQEVAQDFQEDTGIIVCPPPPSRRCLALCDIL
jgi:hypothetical protein